MMVPEDSAPIAQLMPTISDYSHTAAERQELQDITLRLRRAKRRLLLKSAEKPSNNVDRLREILMKLSVESSGDDYPNALYSMSSMSSSLGNSSSSME
jgi:galactokinase/mevalonate kinase-like predicted kinase